MHFVPSNEFKTFATTLGIMTAVLLIWGIYTTVQKPDQAPSNPNGGMEYDGDRAPVSTSN